MSQNNQTILGSLLESLASGEKQRFRRWLLSETRGRITHSVKLFDLWMEHSQQLPPDEILWVHLFPEIKGAPRNDLDLRRVKSRLSKSLKRFISLQQVQENQMELDLALLSRFLHQHQYDLFLKFYSAQLRELNKVTVRNAAYFKQRFELLSSYQNYLALTGREIELNLIQELDACIELWHLHQVFFLAATNLSLSKSRSLSLHYEPGEVNTLKAIWWERQTHLPLLSLYRQILLIISNPDLVDLQQALQHLVEVKDHISLIQKSNFYRYLLNVGIRAVNQKADKPSSQNLLDLILVGIEEKLIQDADGHIPNMFFRAMIESSLRAAGLESTLPYFKQFLPLIPIEDQKETDTFLKARFLLYQKRYADLEKHFKGFDFSRKGDKIRKRLFLLEAAFECRPESFEDKILPEAIALKRYLQRHKKHLSETLRERHLVLVGWAIRFWEKYYDKDQLEKLEQEVARDVNHPFSTWLHGHIKERIVSLEELY